MPVLINCQKLFLRGTYERRLSPWIFSRWLRWAAFKKRPVQGCQEIGVEVTWALERIQSQASCDWDSWHLLSLVQHAQLVSACQLRVSHSCRALVHSLASLGPDSSSLHH